MTVWAWIILAAGTLLGLALFSQWILDNPRRTVDGGVVWRLVRGYARLFHRVRIVGAEHIPPSGGPRGLILVSNHTAGVDPAILQLACPFEIRWLMASDMRHPLGEWFWGWARIIFIGRDGEDSAGLREAIRHVKQGGELGIFPEGGIERPARHVRPFHPGVGFIIRRTGAPVLCAVIEGTPEKETAWESLGRTSRATVTFHPPIDYSAKRLDAGQIAEDLRRRYLEWTGWPAA